MSPPSTQLSIKLRRTCDRYTSLVIENSNIFSDSSGKLSNVIKKNDCEIGEIVGQGGFSTIRAISVRGKNSLCVSKSIHKNMDRAKLFNAVIDLAKEAMFLSALSHRNIISLHGTGSNPGTVEYFLVLDRLECCLVDRFKVWEAQRVAVINQKLCKHDQREEKQKLMDQRLIVMLDISAGLTYLHEKNIIYRDLKPENVGISFDGKAKLFDFGLAKELKENDRVGPDQYNCTKMSGTRRYMAREVFKGEPYGLPIDVYAFSLLLWELCSLDLVFAEMDSKEHEKTVFKNGRRPKIKRKWPDCIIDLMTEGWSDDFRSRPKMKAVFSKIDKYLRDRGIPMVLQ